MTTSQPNDDSQQFSLYHTEENMAGARLLMQRYIPLFAHCASVLDIGCGPGMFLDMIKEHNPVCQSLGIDIDQAMVDRVTQRGFRGKCLPVTRLSELTGERFDGIYAGHIIEHLTGNEALIFLSTCYTLLNPGGLFLCKTPNWEVPYVRHEGFWLDITHVRPYPARLLDKILNDIGYVNVRAFAEAEGLHDVVAMGVKQP